MIFVQSKNGLLYGLMIKKKTYLCTKLFAPTAQFVKTRTENLWNVNI